MRVHLDEEFERAYNAFWHAFVRFAAPGQSDENRMREWWPKVSAAHEALTEARIGIRVAQFEQRELLGLVSGEHRMWTVMHHVHYECGNAIGVAFTEESAKRVAQRHSDVRAAQPRPLTWSAADPKTGAIGSDASGYDSYEVRPFAVEPPVPLSQDPT